MKIALYHPWLKSRGGAEKVLLEILERSEHDVTLFTLYHDPDNTFARFDEHDVTIIGENTAPSGFLDRSLRFGLGTVFRNLPLDGYDALVVSEAGLGCLIAARNHDLPVHCYCHTPLRANMHEFRGTYRSELNPLLRPFFDLGSVVYSFLEKRAWRNFDSVMANSELTERRIRKKGLYSGEMDIVHPGIDPEDFAPGSQDAYFLYPSRFRRYKRQDLAIKAFQEADIEGFRLVLAGSSQEEDYIQELEEMAGENIEIRTDVPEEEWQTLYENCYAVLFMAENEDWGLAPLEAMAAGKPVIAVNEGGYTEAVQHGETGVLVDAAPTVIGAAMTELAEDEEMAAMLGKHGREVVEKYTWDRFIERFDEVVR